MTTTLKSKSDIVDFEVTSRLRGDDCAKTISFRRYRRTGQVKRIGPVARKPDLAPAHRKPDAQILRELTDKIDDGIRERNAVGVPSCSPCDFLETKIDRKEVNKREFYHGWTEKFELRDAENNVIRGVAKYRATGRATVETTVFEKLCDPRFGDDPEDFERVSFDPDALNVQVVAGHSLKEFYNALPRADRDELELFEGGQTTD